MAIWVDEQNKGFALQTNGSSYVFGINEKGRLQHLYWGAPIDPAEALPLLGTWGHSSFDAEIEREVEEFSFWGGVGYVEPSLKVTWPDGVRDFCPQYTGCLVDRQNGKETLTLTFRDEVYPFEVRLSYAAISEHDVLERSVSFANLGDEPVLLETIQSAAWTMPVLRDCRFTHVTGKWAGEFQLRRTFLSEGKKCWSRGAALRTAMPTRGLPSMTGRRRRTAATSGSGRWRGAATGRSSPNEPRLVSRA
ncbi:hypothetical protein HMSSN139_02370 [Paenibacillus sp. HMSSN-139]|nr:hypothetical protein HMSSN139_02370 [Paenibacillus sp. HMSSN-139]